MRTVETAGEPITYMQLALRLAARGRGQVSPNPLVGAVVVRQDRVVGQGYHRYARRDHAEVVALRQAGDQARGGDLYVTLEPCSHQGRTPPCVEAIVASGVKRVFVAVSDPNPLVNGTGIESLRRQGVEVHLGLGQEAASEQNRFFFHWMRHRQPFVSLKLALTLDGRLATRTGDSRWITAETSRRWAHRLRFEHDAILVGVGTVLADDPALDVRGARRNRITKVILDAALRTPPSSRLFESGDPVLLFHADETRLASSSPYPEGATLVGVPARQGRLDWATILQKLGSRDVTSLLVEGGGAVAGSLVEGGWVDSFHFFYGPKLVGSGGIPAIGAFQDLTELASAPQVEITRVRRLGPDLLVQGRIRRRPEDASL